MNYARVYNDLIEKAKNRQKPLGITEVHHIVPAAFGGSNDASNLVCLSLREHFIAHVLLFKMQTTNDRRIRMFQPLKFMIPKMERLNAGDSKKFEVLKNKYYANHQMQLSAVRDKVSESVQNHFKLKEYVWKMCACGCGSEVCLAKPNSIKNRYIKGHFAAKNGPKMFSFICGCGCGMTGVLYKGQKKDMNFIFGHHKTDPAVLSRAASKFISSLSAEQKAARSKASWGQCDHKKRVEAMKEGKSSLLQAVLSDGTTIQFRSHKIPETIMHDYGKIKDIIKRHSGVDKISLTQYSYLEKYSGGNKWKK